MVVKMSKVVILEKCCILSEMPKLPYTAEYLVGYLHNGMNQVRRILYRLENQEDYSRQELLHIRDDLLEANADAEFQSTMIKDERARPVMLEFRELMRRAVIRRNAREKRLSDTRARSEGVSMDIQFGSVVPEMLIGRRSPTREDLEPYASDNSDEFPVHLMSTVRPTRNFAPIRTDPPGPGEPSTSRDADLRHQLVDRRIAANVSVQQERRESARPTARAHERSRDFVPSRNSDRSRSEREGQASSAASTTSYRSYVSQPQEQFHEAVQGVPYPPWGVAPPTPLVRKDPSLIGRSEIFVRRPQNPKICALCQNGAQHKMYRCTTFQRMGLQEKWYTVLKLGVCLNCLIFGHSHFTCSAPGACEHCDKRHNSKLCPDGPINNPDKK